MISHPSFPRIVLVLAVKVPCVGKPLSSRQTGMVSHPRRPSASVWDWCVRVYLKFFMMCSNREKNH